MLYRTAPFFHCWLYHEILTCTGNALEVIYCEVYSAPPVAVFKLGITIKVAFNKTLEPR